MTDLTNELRRLAQAASHPTTKGRWMRLFGERTVYDRMEDGCRGIPVVSTDTHPPSPSEAACLDFIAAANPAAVIELLDRLEAAEKERDALQAKIKAMEKQEPFDADSDVFRSSFEAALKAGNWPATRQGDGYRSPSTQIAWRIAFSTVNRLKLYLDPGAKGEEK